MQHTYKNLQGEQKMFIGYKAYTILTLKLIKLVLE